MIFENIGLKVPTILLPKDGVNMDKWAVVACDQFTSQPDYWDKVKELVADDPSTLNLIFPEVYLESDDSEERIQNINTSMKKYMEEDILVEQKLGFMLVDRKTSQAESRKGLIVALDLEMYSYETGSETLIRATEGTIVARLPSRIKVRQNAPIELPHIMVVIDDPDKTVIEPLFEEELEKAYDFELMMDSGHIKGYKIDNEEMIDKIAQKLILLADRELFNKKYGVCDTGVLLYAMGDGNHSFATAKAIWEKLKEDAEDREAIMSHPARFALVELVNVHDPGLVFEPIHRVMFNIDLDQLFEKMNAFYNQMGCEFSFNLTEGDPKEELKKLKAENTHLISFAAENKKGILIIKDPKLNLEVGTLQAFIDNFLEENKQATVDYIHGDEVVEELGSKPGNIGFFLPVMSKHDLFKTVILDGALPRKTFSMGEADEKRFYLECRKIK